MWLVKQSECQLNYNKELSIISGEQSEEMLIQFHLEAKSIYGANCPRRQSI